ncbi:MULTISPECIES: hypothetical protein [unclassified Streptomyces]|uniref:hypothetical protein n=1 Tax=unclassified Streptomyces TaxID=2593676 RepID=UPI003D765F49
MAEERDNGGQADAPVPRDMQDQQAGPGDDRWEVGAPDRLEETDENAPADGGDGDVPDTDEAGTGRRGAAPPTAEHPTPDESPA